MTVCQTEHMAILNNPFLWINLFILEFSVFTNFPPRILPPLGEWSSLFRSFRLALALLLPRAVCRDIYVGSPASNSAGRSEHGHGPPCDFLDPWTSKKHPEILVQFLLQVAGKPSLNFQSPFLSQFCTWVKRLIRHQSFMSHAGLRPPPLLTSQPRPATPACSSLFWAGHWTLDTAGKRTSAIILPPSSPFFPDLLGSVILHQDSGRESFESLDWSSPPGCESWWRAGDDDRHSTFRLLFGEGVTVSATFAMNFMELNKFRAGHFRYFLIF